jgi:hypothetical protein
MKISMYYHHKKSLAGNVWAHFLDVAAPLMFAIFFFFALESAALAQQHSVAVFPVEDLSRGINSPNLDITRYLNAELVARGLNVALEDDIIAFMAAERIRWLGFLNTDHLLLAKNKLGVDLILFGTVSQNDAKNSPTFGLSLNLVRTTDGRTIWTSNGGLSLADMQHMLGLYEPTTLDDLLVILVNKVLADLPAELDEKANQSLIYNVEDGEMPPTLQVKRVTLSPRYVQPGEQVKCSVQIDTDKMHPEIPQIFIKVGNRIHLAQQTKDGLFYEASWTGSEIEKGIFREVGHEALQLASTDLKPQFFEGVWMGALDDAIYPVSLILRWQDGNQQLAFIGNYTVDSTSPEIDLKITGRQSRYINGLLTFKNKIHIMPTMKKREPFSRWKIWVENGAGEVVINDEGRGKMPGIFHWTGHGANGYPVEEGIYQLVLKGWDRAGNETETSEEIFYRPNKVDLIVDVVRVNDGLQVTLDTSDKEVPLVYWLLEVWRDTGELRKSANGNKLPASFIIPMDFSKTSIPVLAGHIAIQDIIGNKTMMNIEDLYLLAIRKSGNPDEETTETPDDTDDSWAWLSEK